MSSIPPRVTLLDASTLGVVRTIDLPGPPRRAAVDGPRRRVLLTRGGTTSTGGRGELMVAQVDTGTVEGIPLPATAPDVVATTKGWAAVFSASSEGAGLLGETLRQPALSVDSTFTYSATRGNAAVPVGSEIWLDEREAPDLDDATARALGVPDTARIRAWKRGGTARRLRAPAGLQVLLSDGRSVYAALGPASAAEATHAPAPTTIALLERRSGRPRSSAPVEGLDRIVTRGAVDTDTIAVAAYDGLDPTDPGSRVAAFDAATLKQRWVLEELAGPNGVAVGRGRVWITCVSTSQLVQVDASTGKVQRRIDLPQLGRIETVLYVP